MKPSLCWALVVAVCAAGMVQVQQVRADEELRRCTNDECRKYAFSDTWSFCPSCGTKLPAVTASSGKGSGETIVGQIYKNHDERFQIEVPGPRWKFVTKGNGLEEFNSDASVGFQSQDDIYGIVIVENFPGSTLADYAGLIAPKLQERVKLVEKAKKLDGQDALQLKWEGKLNNVDFHFYITLVGVGDTKYQIVNWCLANVDTKEIEAQVAAIQESFKVLKSDASANESAPDDEKAPTAPDGL